MQGSHTHEAGMENALSRNANELTGRGTLPTSESFQRTRSCRPLTRKSPSCFYFVFFCLALARILYFVLFFFPLSWLARNRWIPCKHMDRNLTSLLIASAGFNDKHPYSHNCTNSKKLFRRLSYEISERSLLFQSDSDHDTNLRNDNNRIQSVLLECKTVRLINSRMSAASKQITSNNEFNFLVVWKRCSSWPNNW